MTERDLSQAEESLKRAWEERGRHRCRDFYVASHAGWNDPVRWAGQARRDVNLILAGFGNERLRGAQILELGCGVGRLVPELLERGALYSGCDISASMVAEARRRHSGSTNARFAESSGADIPKELRDRRYDVILSLAVLIHCPKPVIRGLLEAARSQLAPRGELRVQVRADPSDLEGIAPIELPHDGTADEGTRDLGDVDLTLAEASDYMGHAFRHDEAKELFASIHHCDVTLVRFDPFFIYARVVASDPDPSTALGIRG